MNNKIVKIVAGLVGGTFLVSSQIPVLAPFAAILAPLGGLIMGAFHVNTPPAVKP